MHWIGSVYYECQCIRFVLFLVHYGYKKGERNSYKNGCYLEEGWKGKKKSSNVHWYRMDKK